MLGLFRVNVSSECVLCAALSIIHLERCSEPPHSHCGRLFASLDGAPKLVDFNSSSSDIFAADWWENPPIDVTSQDRFPQIEWIFLDLRSMT